MKMRSPIVAMLWENWRLTRVEAVQRVSLGLVLASFTLAPAHASATPAFFVLIMLHAMIWFSIAKLNGGRLMDGYKPGFPFYLLYPRPLPTVVIVGVAMAYDAVSCAALYVVSAALVGFAFGKTLPLFSVTLWLVVSHLAYACVQWSTPKRVVQWVGSIAFSLPMFILLKNRVGPSLQVEFSSVDNIVMVLLGVLSFGLTVIGVARQRRGDAVASVPRTAGSGGGYPDWLVSLFRFPCPTSSATRAQVWFELKSSGLPVLMIGLAVALLICLLFAISIPFAPARHAAVLVTFMSVPIVLFTLGGNAFGIRRRQGRTYASAFETTQPYGTAQLVGLKVLVRVVCLLVALIAIGASVWTFSSLVSEWAGWMTDGNKNASQRLLQLRHALGNTFGGKAEYAHAAQAVVASIAIVSLVAWQAAREALRALYPRRLLAGGLLLYFCFLAIGVLTMAGRAGIVPASLGGEIFRATFWVSGAAMAISTIYLLWSGFAERALTIRYACGALVISAVFAAAWRAGIPAGGVAGILWLALAVLMAGLLAPWSLSRIRHI